MTMTRISVVLLTMAGHSRFGAGTAGGDCRGLHTAAGAAMAPL
jgi:hypothetical protein